MTILRFLRCFNLKLYVQGTVIKTNSNQRYATNSETGFLLRELARRAVVPVQVRGTPHSKVAMTDAQRYPLNLCDQ